MVMVGARYVFVVGPQVSQTLIVVYHSSKDSTRAYLLCKCAEGIEFLLNYQNCKPHLHTCMLEIYILGKISIPTFLVAEIVSILLKNTV